jgi:hypothetical protein
VRPSAIEIRIDEVVLEGIPFARGAVVTDALRSALKAALRRPANAALFDALRNGDRLDGGEVSLARADSNELGDALAAALVAALRARAPLRRGAPPR